MNFREFLEMNEKLQLQLELTATQTKTGLYPLQYMNGIYPPQYFIPYSADAIYYITIDDRILKDGEGPPFKISHIPSKPPEPRWKLKYLGKEPPVNLVYGNREGPPWKISHIP